MFPARVVLLMISSRRPVTLGIPPSIAPYTYQIRNVVGISLSSQRHALPKSRHPPEVIASLKARAFQIPKGIIVEMWYKFPEIVNK